MKEHLEEVGQVFSGDFGYRGYSCSTCPRVDFKNDDEFMAHVKDCSGKYRHYEAVRELFLRMVDRGMGAYAEHTLWDSAERAINFADSERPK